MAHLVRILDGPPGHEGLRHGEVLVHRDPPGHQLAGLQARRQHLRLVVLEESLSLALLNSIVTQKGI